METISLQENNCTPTRGANATCHLSKPTLLVQADFIVIRVQQKYKKVCGMFWKLQCRCSVDTDL